MTELEAAVGAEHLAREGEHTVARPAAASEVAALVRAARAGKLTVAVAGEPRVRALTISTERMVQVLHLDETSLLCHAQAGITVGALEAMLESRGLSLGALSPTTRLRTVGAVLAAPRPSEATPRGRLTDACAAVDGVLPDGTIVNTRLAPRRATGPDLSHALLGARGSTGVITAAWLRCSRLPAARAWQGWAFSDGKSAIAAARAFSDRGGRAADLSLVDGAQAQAVIGPGSVAAAEVLWAVRLEGVAEMVAAEAALAVGVAVATGAREVATAAAEAWLSGRGVARRHERFVAMDALAAAWPTGRCELTGFHAAGAALLDDAPPARGAPLMDALSVALRRRLDPDGLFSDPDDRTP